MQVNFQQGIVKYPYTGSIQQFLTRTGSFVNLVTTNGVVDITFAHKDTNYLLTESNNINNAWGPIPVLPSGQYAWIYWDINTLSAVISYGFTLLAPTFGTTAPVSPQEDQHWFNTSTKTMNVYESGRWRIVIRVFAAKVNLSLSNPFVALGNVPGAPFAGSQVGLMTLSLTGRIITDDAGKPIIRQNGTFFTTEDQFYLDGSPINTIKLEANVLKATAIEPIPAYFVIKLSDFDQIELAGYNDLNETFIGMAMESGGANDVITLISQGTVTNPYSISNPTGWNWTVPGAALWVLENGELTEDDPHITDIITYPKSKPPIARVISEDTIFFDQGLGGIGEQGPSGIIDLASDTVIGITKLSAAPSNPANPIAVSTSGGTMTGLLTLSGDPSLALQAATKQYVDNSKVTEPANQIVYGTGTGVDSSIGLTYIATAGLRSEPLPIAGAPTDISQIRAVSTTGTGGEGGGILLLMGGESATGQGGDAGLRGGDSSGDGHFSGSVYLQPGQAWHSNGIAGSTVIMGGSHSNGGTAGDVSIQGGTSSLAGAPGNIIFSTGNSVIERLRILPNGAWSVGPGGLSWGAAGEVLTSSGAGGPPAWQALAASPGGANTNVQFNDVGAFGGDGAFDFNKISRDFYLNFTPPTTYSIRVFNSDGVVIAGANGGADGILGASVSIVAGDGYTAPAGTPSQGGDITISAGDGGDGTGNAASGGNVNIIAGERGVSGTTAVNGIVSLQTQNVKQTIGSLLNSYSLMVSGSSPALGTVELLLPDGTQLVMSDNSVWNFEIRAVYRNNTTLLNGAFVLQGCIKRNTGVATTAISGIVQINILSNENPTMVVTATTDVITGALKITAGGNATAEWVATVNITERIT